MSRPTDPYGDHGGWKSGETGAKIGAIARELWDSFADWEKRKEEFPRSLTDVLCEKYPGWNVVVFHDQCSEYYFVNGAHEHIELEGGPFRTSFGYEVWVFESGYFCRHGAGGWKNWACKGYLYSPGSESRVIFTNAYGSARAIWDEIMDENVHMNKPLLQQRCNENARRFTYPYWDSHEWGTRGKDSGDLPPKYNLAAEQPLDDTPVSAVQEKVDDYLEEKGDNIEGDE
ncbi:hypothetical protein TWF481_006074 [Arthrobotrys musiformis]|uniref:Uncharacterized protein n=1 Tax=Arthrobotrys musiformis TaxID=47236 RepID=A0AAV9WFN6_9PEZI